MFATFRHFVENNTWLWLWLCFVGTLVIAVREHRTLWDEIKHTSGKPKKLAICKMVFGWFIVFLSLPGAVASQWSSESTDDKIAKLTGRYNEATNEIFHLKRDFTVATNSITELKVENLKLEVRIQPRRVTPSQKAAVLAIMKMYDGLEKWTLDFETVNDGEARAFSLQIKNLARECGFKLGQDGIPVVAATPNFGVFFLTAENPPLPVPVTHFVEALGLSGVVPSPTTVITNVPTAGILKISVGFKPIK